MKNRDPEKAGMSALDQFLVTALRQSALPFIAQQLDGGFAACNPAFIELTGYSEEELRSLPSALALASPEWSGTVRRAIVTARKMRQPQRLDLEFTRRDGRRVPIEIFVHSILDDAGNPQGYFTCIVDITDRRKLEGQFLQAQKMESIGRLAGGVAHDFNNMLTAIAAHATFLRDNQPAGHPFVEDVTQMLAIVERAAALTRRLLALSREQVIAPQTLDLSILVLDMARMLQRLIGERIELTTQTAPGLGLVRADPRQIEQMLLNLVINARDAMPNGGRIFVELSNVTLDEHYVQHHVNVRAGDYVLLSVSDTGEGMTEEVRSRAFEPFFTTKQPGKGTGLGLATVYGIVRQHAGQIWVYSEPGKGTIFKIYLPRVDETAMAATAKSEHAQAPLAAGRDETILVVEDDSSVRNVLARTLRKLGYRVLVAADGSEGMRLAEDAEECVDLLLADLVLPDVNGSELGRRLMDRWPSMKILCMSGYAQAAAVERGVLEPGAPFLPKPFNRRTLAERVRQVLDERDPAESPEL